MSAGPQIRLLPDGRRLHLRHGPIDLVIGASGSDASVEMAYRSAAARFHTVLDELCGELDRLRAPARLDDAAMTGLVAGRMQAAVTPFATLHFITPMAAVAGAVAEEILGAMTGAADLTRAFVNNGGDIALHLAPGARFRVGMIDRDDRPSLVGHIDLTGEDRVLGIATSGWRGRSFSLGIADAVTVLARTAAAADAAATIIANAVDLPGHRAVRRAPASTIQLDNDLGDRLVTRSVGPLSSVEIDTALQAGVARTRALIEQDLICGAALHLQGVTESVGFRPLPPMRRTISVRQENLVYA
ncbi:UPF0280 family protein [Lichenifustis flavocetrariae]|uniref:UPF0280 family protein n=1 Tax=Lichenifustis flavocetrariae TaxID=2949735 RepID=A0AA41YS71_9HYPH|nr:UPF0280 family protein [Lichenifustis flavocetrariae]MCW6507209.1 UPF0280 family protein [Lichenifustis flavocetrariae]